MNAKKANLHRQNTDSSSALYQKALYWLNRHEHEKALNGFDSVLERYPDHLLAHRSRGLALFQLGKFHDAALTFHKLHEKLPDDLLLLKYCGIAYNSLGNFESAIQFLVRYAKKVPNDFDAWTALTYAAGKSQRHTDSMMYATKALSIDPTNTSAYNNLGAALLGVQQLDAAQQAFETALILEPNNVDAISNIATLKEKRGEYPDAAIAYDKLLAQLDKKTDFCKEILYRSSFSYLATGQLKEGWRRYDYGFYPKDTASRTPKRIFSVPKWKGEIIFDKRLLVWGEQGLGDELWFYGLLNEALAICPNIILECEPRLVGLMTRSFPDVKVRAINLGPMILMDSQEFDLHIPAGSLMSLFRNHIDDLKKFKPYLKAEPNLIVDISQRLTKFKGKKLIGLCWRSGKLDANRNKHYLPLDELAPLLKLQDCVFVNLQYGDCEEELCRVEQQLGISIVRWADVDLKNDLERVAAIISCLDIVVSAGTAVFRMAEVIGQKTILFGPRGGWTHLGQKNYPWSNYVYHISPLPGDDLDTVVPKILEYVNANVTASQSKTD